MVGRIADRRVQNNLGTARQPGLTVCGEDPNRCMGLETLRQTEAIRMGLFRIGHMCAQRDLGAERRALRMEGGSWRGARQKGLQDERIESEGREPLPQQILKCGPCLAHGANRASKRRFGQVAREDVMGKISPGTQSAYLWGVRAKSLKRMVGVRGFEPPTPSSRTRCATRLRYTPTSRAARTGVL